MSDDKKKLVPVEMGDRGVVLKSMDEAWRFACAVKESGLAPRGMDTPQKILIALQAGSELGLSPMRSLSSVTVINGRVGVMGDAAKAIVRTAGLLKPGTDFFEEMSGEGDDLAATVIVHRKGVEDPLVGTFSVKQAKKAKLWGKPGPWSEYPERMLKYRALGFLLRDHFSDALMGLAVAEEVIDIPPAKAEPAALPAPKEPDPLLEPTEDEIEAKLEEVAAETMSGDRLFE